MSDQLREEIRNNLKLKDIYELLEIWRINNRVVWSDTTFEVLRELLEERIGEVPPQDEPILENKEDFEEKDNRLEEWETRLLNDENQPGLYNTLDVLKLRHNVNKVAIAAIVVYLLLALLNFSFIRMLFQGIVLSPSEIVKSFPDMMFTIFSVSFQIVITIIPLKALVQILRILMQMEFNSRKGKPLVE